MVFGLFGAELSSVARWIAALGGVTIILLAPAAARSIVTTVQLTEEGVTGPGFLKPAHIPWSEVVLVTDDQNGIIVQSATRSVRINFVTVSVGSPFGTIRIGSFDNPEQMVRFVLAHIPKSSLLEMRYWLPT